MFDHKTSSLRRVACTAVGLAILPLSPAVLAQHAGEATGIAQLPAVADAASLLNRADELLNQGQVVRSREIAIGLLTGKSGFELTDSQHSSAYSLVLRVNRKFSATSPLEISLQKAEVAIEDGNLRLADRHAGAVASSPSATPAQTMTAAILLEQSQKHRLELAPLMSDTLSQALADFAAGKYADAKIGLDMAFRSGVTLSEMEQQQLVEYQDRIVALELAEGRLFNAEAQVSLGVLQPGVLKKRDQAQEQPDEAITPPVEAAEQDEPPIDIVELALRAQALSTLAEADLAFDERRLVEASNKYAALDVEFRRFLSASQQEHVTRRLADVRIQLQAGGRGDILTGVIGERDLIKQQILAVYDNEKTQVNDALASGDTVRARNIQASARLGISKGRAHLSEAEFERFTRELDQMAARIANVEEDRFRRENADREAQLIKQAKENEKEQAREREQRILELIDRARGYQAEQRYDEALQTIDQLLFIDPINPIGQLLRDVLTDVKIYTVYNDIQNRKQVAYAMQSLQNEEASIAPHGIVNYPNDWPQISNIRGGMGTQYADSFENRSVYAALEKQRIPTAFFEKNTLEEAMAFVGDVANVNIDVDWRSLEAIGIGRDSTVSLNLSNIQAKTVLDKLLEKVSGLDYGSRASWTVSDGVLSIASESRLRRNTSVQLYDIRDLLMETPDYDDVPPIDLQSVLDSEQSSSAHTPFQTSGNGEEDLQAAPDRDMTQQIIDVIQQSVDFEGWSDNGGDTGYIQHLNGSLIVTNTPKSHRQIQGLLNKLREVRAMQINVETRFLLVNQDFFEQIGFDLDVVFGANNSQVRAAQATDPTIQGGDFFDFGNAPNPKRVVSGGGVNPTEQAVVNPRPWSPIGFGQGSLGLAAGLMPSEGIAAGILGGAPALGIAGQFLDDIQVDFLVQATQADRRSTQLTAPRLTFTNGQVANIYVATQTAFISDLSPIVGESAVGFDPTIAVVTEGVTLRVEGTVSADRRYVTMNIDAGLSKIEDFGQIPVTAVAGGQLIDSSQTSSFIQTPIVTVTRVQTTATVPDQGTVLLGGQRLVSEVEVETGVPVLSKLPILNRFFSNRIETKEESTLLILVKPTILIQSEQEETQFPGLADSITSGFGG